MKRKITFTAAMLLFCGMVCAQTPGSKSSENLYAPGGLLTNNILYENFEIWPPAGWTFINNWIHGGTGNLFLLWDYLSLGGVTTPLGGGKFVSMVSGYNEGHISWMISPPLVIRKGDFLFFWANGMSGAHYLEIVVSQSNNSVSSFTDCICSFSFNDSTVNQWIKFKLDLSKYEGKTIYIAWRIIVNGFSYFMIDMVKAGPELISDAALLLDQPPDYVPAGELAISGTILNQGSGSITQAEVSWQVDDGPLYKEYLKDFTITEDQGYHFVCKNKYVTSTGNHTLKVTIEQVNGHGSDEDQSNDSIKCSFYACSDSAPKIHLFEVFTNSGCGSCPDFNKNVIDPAVRKFIGKIAVVKYQMNWPYSRDYYIPETDIRRDYYGGIGWVPYFFVDGITSIWLADNTPPEEILGYIDDLFMSGNEQRTVAAIKSKHTVSQSTKNIVLDATITPYFTKKGYKVFICVVEKVTTGNAISNVEPAFFHVLMKMLPNGQGIYMDFVDGIPQKINLSANLSNTHIEEFSDLAVVLFIQDIITKEVIQAAYSEDVITEASDVTTPGNDIKIYPNPSNGILNISEACGANLEVCDIQGRVLFSVIKANCMEEADLTSFKKGIYLLKIKQREKTSFRKLILY